MVMKQSPKCENCDEESQSLSHLFLTCISTQQLYACFEKHFKLDNMLTDLEKLIGVDPSQHRPKLIVKKLTIFKKDDLPEQS